MSHYCWWNRRIANPIKYNGYEGRGRTAMLILKHQILPVVLLRRTKLMCAADLALPPRTVILRKDPFDRQEEDFYEALYTQSQAAFGGCGPLRRRLLRLPLSLQQGVPILHL